MAAKIYHKRVGQGPVLVLLHGWGWSSGIWGPLVPILSQSYQLVLVDLPGFGKSPLALPAYTFAQIAPLLLEIVPEPAAWLGWSLGGSLAFWLGLNYPRQVTRLITVTSTPRFLEAPDWPGMAPATLTKFADDLETDFEKTLTDFLKLQLRGAHDYTKIFPELHTQLFSSLPQPAALRGGLELLRTTDLRVQLSRLDCPSLHIFGSLDRLVPAQIAALLPAYLARGRCEILPHCGHLPFLAQPQLFMELLREFITA
jgi:pimeloyl-[acyl-carrier protein] methyl ester esterase